MRERAQAPVWVFGYGSLMWRPGFEPAERVAAHLFGYHRALCLWSWRHRGTRASPGLVLGLERGGSCKGVALRIPRGAHAEVLAYLHGREMVHYAYRELTCKVSLEDGRRVRAFAYVACREHPQYAGALSLERQFETVRAARGEGGTNAEYVLSTERHLRALGCPCARLGALARRLLSETSG